MRSTGGQPARFYGLAKVHKVNTPLRPVLSLPGSSYYNLNKVLAKFFENIEGANIETNSLDAREILDSTNLEPNESLISLDVKSLYTNVPLKEAIDIALRKLYEQDEPPSFARKTTKRLLNMAVSQVHFKCNETFNVQKDGLVMEASLAVILANLWLKQHKTALSRDIPEMFWPEKNLNRICLECKKKVTYRSKGVECECCLIWFHVKCGDISDDEYRNINETFRYCRKCIAIREKNKSVQQAKLFFRYVDDIVRTVKCDPQKVLRAAKLLHPNLQFTIETQNTNGKLAFLDLQITIDRKRNISCGWYQKPTDAVTILNFRSCIPFRAREAWLKEFFTGFSAIRQHGKNIIKLWKSTVSIGWITNIRKFDRRGLHPMPLKRSPGRAKTKRTWLKKRSPVIIAVIHHPSWWSNIGGITVRH